MSRLEKYDKTKYKYISEIQQMMFVFGEISEPLIETACAVEDIVRSQVIDIIIMGAALAQSRGSRSMAPEDLIFLIRHDRSKVSRLKTYLNWKDVRKNVKDSGAPEAGEELLEEETTAEKQDKKGKARVKLCWEFVHAFPEAQQDDSEDEEDNADQQDDAQMRLKRADDVTRAMTRAEYEHYSECRQASFTYRRAKKFRDWANMSTYIDMKPNDDIMDILGFLTFEMVSKLTEMSLDIKVAQEEQERRSGAPTPAHQDTAGSAGDGAAGFRGSSGCGIFSPPPSERTPLRPAHILEAFRRVQNSRQPIRNFRAGLARSQVSLI